MKSKLFKLFSLVVLILIGVSMGFAQVGTYATRTTVTDTAFQVYTKIGAAENGYDTTTFTGLTSPFTVRGNYWTNQTERNALTNQSGLASYKIGNNIVPWSTGVTAGTNRYIRFFQGDYAPKFKFYNKDTLFLTFASGNSNYRARFQFDSSQAIKIYTAGAGNIAYTNYLPVMHVLRFKPSYDETGETFPTITAWPNGDPLGVAAPGPFLATNQVRVATANGYNVGVFPRNDAAGVAPAGSRGSRSLTNYSGNIDNNSVNVRGFNPDTLMIVFDSVINTTSTEFPNIYISNLYVQSIDSMLQGRAAGVSDTLLAAVGRGPNAYNPGGGVDTRNSRAPGTIAQGTNINMYQPSMNVDPATAAPASFTFRSGVATFGATPVVKFTLLPGVAAFVRWNVGFDPNDGWTNFAARPYRIAANGALIPTQRRQHVRVRRNINFANFTTSPDSAAFRASDTCTIIDSGSFNPATRLRDTLYIFDADSNVTIDTVGSSTVIGTILGTTGLTALDSALSNSVIFPYNSVKTYQTTISPRGRVVIDWQMTNIQGRNYLAGYRLTKVRLATNLTGIGNDTLNGPTPLQHSTAAGGFNLAQFAQGGSVTNAMPGNTVYVDTCVLFRAARPSKLVIYYRPDTNITLGTGWTLWNTDIPMTKAAVLGSQSNPYSFKVVVQDTFNNLVDKAVVGIKANLNNVVWDSNYRNVAYMPRTAYYGFGSRRYLGPDGVLQVPSAIPGTKIFTLSVRNDSRDVFEESPAYSNTRDDAGVGGAHFRFYDQCLTSVSFTAYLYSQVDTSDAVPFNVWKTYALTATGSASSGIPTYLRVSPNTFNGRTFTRSSSFPISPDTVQTTTVDPLVASPYRNVDTLEITVTDDCERAVPVTDTSKYQVYAPALIKYNGTTLPSLLNTTTRRDSTGSWVANSKFIPVAGGNKLRILYTVPNVRHDTVRLTVYYKDDVTINDNIIVTTVSGAPKTLALIRPTGNSPAFPANTRTVQAATFKGAALKTDSTLFASSNDLYKGVAGTYNAAYDNNPNTYTFIAGQTRDVNGDTVDGAGAVGSTVTWTLLGPSPNSMKVADPSYIFGEDAAGTPKFGFTPVNTIAAATALGKAGRAVAVPIATDGNAYALIVSDRVGGGGGVNYPTYTSHHVFPVEKATVFPNAFDAADSVYRYLDIDGTTWKNISDYTGTTSTNKVKDNGRGFNQLVATFQGTNIDYTYDPGWPNSRRPIIYHVQPDTTNDLRVAFLDMTGLLFSSATGDVNDKPELQGRQTAKIIHKYTSPANETTVRRLVVAGNSNTAVGSTSYNVNGKNFSGNINTIYVREYDRFGNPILRDGGLWNFDLKLWAHSQYRPPFKTAVSFSHNTPATTAQTYYTGSAGWATYAGVTDSSGVVVPSNAVTTGAATWATGTSDVFTVRFANKWIVNAASTLPTALPTGFATTANAQLRGAVGFKYQTMWADSNRNIVNGNYPNTPDTAIFYAQLNKSAYPDTALVVSEDFPMYPMTVNMTEGGTAQRVVGNSFAAGTGVYVVSPDAYPMPWFNLLTGQNIPTFYSQWLAVNLMNIGIDTNWIATTGSNPTLSLRGNSSLGWNTDPKWVKNPNPPIYDMPGFTANSFVEWYTGGAKSGGIRIPTVTNTRFSKSNPASDFMGGGWVDGTRILYKGYRDGLYKLKITSLNSAMAVTQRQWTNIYRYFPDGAHFVSMTNPNSNHPELEPSSTSLYPVRANYFTNGGSWNPDKAYNIAAATTPKFDTLGQYNGFWADAYNYNPPNDIRNYSSLGTSNNVDTIFYNQDYRLVLRPYDRYGNLIHIPKLWLQNGVSFNQPFPGQNILTNKPTTGTQANEWQLKIDTNNIKDTLSLSDTLIVRFIQDANTPVSANGLFLLKYTNAFQNFSLDDIDTLNYHGGHDLTLASDMVMGFRNIFVKAQLPPAAFTVNAVPGRLVRVDNAASTWTPTWTAAASTNLANDGITYKLYVTNTAASTAISKTYTAGANLFYTLDSATLKNDLGLGTGTWNRDIKWYVIATNTWGLTRTSTNSDSVTVELNTPPTVAITPITAPVIINGTTTWTLNVVPTDNNGVTYGATTPQTVTSYGVTYPNTVATIDSVFYQITLSPKLPNASFPNNTMATAAPKVDTVATGNPWKTYTNAELWALLGGATGEDTATYDITVKAVDRKVGTGTYNFETATGIATAVVTITKIDNGYYAKITQDSLTGWAMYTTSVLNLAVTDSQQIKVTAYDSNNDIIRGFNNVTDGTTTPSVKLRINVLTPSSAPLETVQTKIISYIDPTLGYQTVTVATDGTFSIPAKIFVSGVATFYLQDRRANERINLTINASDNPTLYKVAGAKKDGKDVMIKLSSSDTTLIYNIVPGSVVKIKTTVTPRRANVVFLKKTMEVILTPMDKFNNEVLSIPTGLNSVLYIDDDVLEHDQVGNKIIYGKTYVYLTPLIVHDIPNYNVLNVGGFLPDPVNGLPNPSTGQNVAVLVVDHIPVVPAVSTFKITNDQTSTPITNDQIKLQKHSDKFTFSWDAALDSNNQPLKRSYDPTNQALWFKDQCKVKYTFKIAEWLNYPYVTSSDTLTKITMSGAMLKDIYLYLRVGTAKSVFVNYFIVCEDEIYLYTQPKYADKLATAKKKIEIVDDGITKVTKDGQIPTVYSLDQNYPNPFNPTTNISYSLPKESNVKLTIYNILGQPVRTLINERQSASYQTVVWDGKDDKGMTVSSGTYIYTISAGDFVQTKKMNLLK